MVVDKTKNKRHKKKMLAKIGAYLNPVCSWAFVCAQNGERNFMIYGAYTGPFLFQYMFLLFSSFVNQAFKADKLISKADKQS
jgi:hypothetical protein